MRRCGSCVQEISSSSDMVDNVHPLPVININVMTNTRVKGKLLRKYEVSYR